jgi:hypothetical protein
MLKQDCKYDGVVFLYLICAGIYVYATDRVPSVASSLLMMMMSRSKRDMHATIIQTCFKTNVATVIFSQNILLLLFWFIRNLILLHRRDLDYTPYGRTSKLC